jgi:hypothetical protein
VLHYGDAAATCVTQPDAICTLELNQRSWDALLPDIQTVTNSGLGLGWQIEVASQCIEVVHVRGGASGNATSKDVSDFRYAVVVSPHP